MKDLPTPEEALIEEGIYLDIREDIRAEVIDLMLRRERIVRDKTLQVAAAKAFPIMGRGIVNEQSILNLKDHHDLKI